VSKIFQEVCEIESTFGFNQRAWTRIRNFAIQVYVWVPVAALLFWISAYVHEVGVFGWEDARTVQFVALGMKTALLVASTVPELIFAFLCRIAGEFLEQNKTSLCRELDKACLSLTQNGHNCLPYFKYLKNH
jgi:hypothetical protein